MCCGGFWAHDEVVGRVVGEQPLGSVLARTHGDLHGRNILVADGPAVRFIDPADLVYAHPSTDWARLSADIFSTGLSTKTSSHEWDNIEAWRVELTRFLRGESLRGRPHLPLSCGLALDELTRQREALFADLPAELRPKDWELALALAAEFLRASGRVALLPMPVRVMALDGAVQSLDIAAETMTRE